MQIVGHRGAAGLAPENTLASLQKGLEHGCDELEFDLRVTKDNVVVLHHDAELHDPADNELVIGDHTYDELLAHKPDLTTFEAVLQTFGGKIALLPEIKPDEPLEPILVLIKQYSRIPLTICSFDFVTLQTVHDQLPAVPLAVLERWSGVRATHRARRLGTKRLHMKHKWLWSGFIRSVKRGGYELYAYTLNDAQQARRWARHGLSGVITDFPDHYTKYSKSATLDE